MILEFLIIPPIPLLPDLYGAIAEEGEYQAREKWKFLLKRKSPMKSTQRREKKKNLSVKRLKKG